MENKTIVIIGTTGGIGEVFAQECKFYSENVVLIGRNSAKLSELSNRVGIKNTYELDITDYKKIPDIIYDIEKNIGSIH